MPAICCPQKVLCHPPLLEPSHDHGSHWPAITSRQDFVASRLKHVLRNPAGRLTSSASWSLLFPPGTWRATSQRLAACCPPTTAPTGSASGCRMMPPTGPSRGWMERQVRSEPLLDAARIEAPAHDCGVAHHLSPHSQLWPIIVQLKVLHMLRLSHWPAEGQQYRLARRKQYRQGSTEQTHCGCKAPGLAAACTGGRSPAAQHAWSVRATDSSTNTDTGQH